MAAIDCGIRRIHPPLGEMSLNILMLHLAMMLRLEMSRVGQCNDSHQFLCKGIDSLKVTIPRAGCAVKPYSL